MPKVVDAHIHLSERKEDGLARFARMNGIGYSLEELLQQMQKNGVETGLLLSPPLEGGGALPNDEVVALCRRSGGKLFPVITADPGPNELAVALSLAESYRREVKAVKVRLGYVDAAADSPVFDPLYDYAESEGLPVMFHTGDTAISNGDLARSHPLNLDRLANKRENLKIVLCHFGNPWFEDAAELIYKHPNMYADMSGLTTGGGLYPKKFAEWLAKKISDAVYFAGGADKVIFGTDYPITTYEDALALVKMLEIDEGDKENILHRTAEKVFGI